MIDRESLPVAIIGAGPVGLAAAAHLIERRLRPVVLEKGTCVGASLLDWGHVRMFSPWKYNIDEAAARLLADRWQPPQPDQVPTGRDLVERYLRPLSQVPDIASGLRLGARVTAISRQGLDKMSSTGRDGAPFVIRVEDDGGESEILARAVIDASGTWDFPNPMGLNGLPISGERGCARVSHGIPDLAGARRSEFLGKRVLVIGSGHSAINVALALLELQAADPATQIHWALRSKGVERLLGGGLNDQLPERGALGLAAKTAMETGKLTLWTAFSGHRVIETGVGLVLEASAAGQPVRLELDHIVVATGFRPDFSFLREVRIALDPSVEAPPALAPLIDPNLHSCGTVPPHGVEHLSHPEPDLYIVGSKSYGRAPTFLMKTGYEQVRSVVAEIAGDFVAARRVELVLPQTGVCSVDLAQTAATGCCGGPAPQPSNACCVTDAQAKSVGKPGCGCGSPQSRPETGNAVATEPA